ncbi:MAG: 50S ribosomal protein L10 [Candidatus Marinimicrobia bacterium]|nr:50S ribosomal protein L10 [Candidatus Neomarinimicrobiota bacterium]
MRPEKASYLAELQADVAGADYLLLTDFTGLTVSQATELRRRLWERQARCKVVKNSILRLAAAHKGINGLEALLQGPSAMIYGAGDVAEVAKVVKQFQIEFKKTPWKGAVLGDQMLTGADATALADLPGRMVLLAQVVGTIAAPMTQLVGVLQQKVASVVYVLKAVADKKQA